MASQYQPGRPCPLSSVWGFSCFFFPGCFCLKKVVVVVGSLGAPWPPSINQGGPAPCFVSGDFPVFSPECFCLKKLWWSGGPRNPWPSSLREALPPFLVSVFFRVVVLLLAKVLFDLTVGYLKRNKAPVLLFPLLSGVRVLVVLM